MTDRNSKATVMAWISPAWADHLLSTGAASRDANSNVLYVRGHPRQAPSPRPGRRWIGSQGRMDQLDEARRDNAAFDEERSLRADPTEPNKPAYDEESRDA